jgi:SCY1-like protein 1
LAKNALRKLRTLRHPGIVKVLDTIENETHIYIITEIICPLTWLIKRNSISPETAKWGLHSVALTLKFINGDAASVHGNIRAASIYTSGSGEWKVAGFEVLSSMKEDDAVIYTYGIQLPEYARFAPPEVTDGDWNVIRKNPITAMDSFGLAILIFEVFNGHFRGSDQLGQSKKIPPSMTQSYRRLANINPKARLSAAHFVEQGQRPGSFFKTPLIRLTTDVDNLGLKSESERDQFLR